MKNIGGDEPSGGDIPGPQVLSSRPIMAFDVVLPLDSAVADVTPTGITSGPVVRRPRRVRRSRVRGHGRDRAAAAAARHRHPATDHLGKPINWPKTADYIGAGLIGQIEGHDRLAQPDN